MRKNETVFKRIAQALLIDYSSVYYVDAVTNEYQWYSSDPEYRSLRIAREGTDFFKNMKTDAQKVVYEEDRHFFTEDIQKDNLISAIENNGMKSLEYRLMIDGRPVYHTLRVIRKADSEGDYFILGVKNIDKEVRLRQESEKFRSEREIYNQIAESLAENYDTLYYIYIDTGKYFEFSSNDDYKTLHVPMIGEDFFAETRENVLRFVCPEDRDMAYSMYYKEKLLSMLENRNSFSYKYRLALNGEKVYYCFTVIRAKQSRNLIMCVKNINDDIAAEKLLEDAKKKSMTYEQIAESLALQYDLIYCVSAQDSSYVKFVSNAVFGNLELEEEGKDFFSDVQRNIPMVVYPQDCDRVLDFVDKDRLITMLEDKKTRKLDYRIIADTQIKHMRLNVTWSADRKHFIIGVENIDEEVRREREQKQALSLANEMARRDELTGTKNKTAYTELERAVQSNIDTGVNYFPFAIVVCDINGLKQVNDSIGHKAGDEYIRNAAKLICDIFAHSPVFRIGGDEFVVFLRGYDYSSRDKLLKKLREQVHKNLHIQGAPVIAAGLSEFDPDSDNMINDVFDRADGLMYEDKRGLKRRNASGKR